VDVYVCTSAEFSKIFVLGVSLKYVGIAAQVSRDIKLYPKQFYFCVVPCGFFHDTDGV
jgi:hypothetical protein